MPVVGFSFRQRTSYYYHDMWAYHTFTLGRRYTVMTQHSGTWGSIGAIFLISLVIPMPLNNHFFRAISYQTRLRMVLCVSCYYLPYMLGSISIQQSHLPNFFLCMCVWCYVHIIISMDYLHLPVMFHPTIRPLLLYYSLGFGFSRLFRISIFMCHKLHYYLSLYALHLIMLACKLL